MYIKSLHFTRKLHALFSSSCMPCFCPLSCTISKFQYVHQSWVRAAAYTGRMCVCVTRGAPVHLQSPVKSVLILCACAGSYCGEWCSGRHEETLASAWEPWHPVSCCRDSEKPGGRESVQSEHCNLKFETLMTCFVGCRLSWLLVAWRPLLRQCKRQRTCRVQLWLRCVLLWLCWLQKVTFEMPHISSPSSSFCV